MLFTKLNKRPRVILILQCIGMLSGTSTHLLWVINNGFLSEKYKVPIISRLFWDSLTFLDPIAAVLLIIRPKTGLWMTLIIMIVDVIHNAILSRNQFTVNHFQLIGWVAVNWMLLCQVAFGSFVVITFKGALSEINSLKSLKQEVKFYSIVK